MDVDIVDVPGTPNDATGAMDMSANRLKRGVECGSNEACSDLCIKKVKNEGNVSKKAQPQVLACDCGKVEAEGSNICKVESVSQKLSVDTHQDFSHDMVPVMPSPTETIKEMQTTQDSQDNSYKAEKTDDNETHRMANGCQSIEQCTMIRENNFDNNARGIYFCDYCTFQLFDQRRVKEKCTCEICGRVFSRKHYLRRHIAFYHTNMAETDMDLEY